MEIKTLLKTAREIRGNDKYTLSEIIVRMGKVYGDICRWERNEKKDKEFHTDEELKKELVQTVRKSIGPIATPDEIEFVDKLPKTRSGKIMRRVLKAQELGLPVGDVSTLED